MAEKEVPEDLNWVELEGEWSLDVAFAKLHAIAKRDADASAKLLTKLQEASCYRGWHTHFKFDDRHITHQYCFDIIAFSPGANDDTHVRARIKQSRKKSEIHIELASTRETDEFTSVPGGFTLEPRVSNHGKQMFALVSPDSLLEVEPALLYPWQASRLIVDTLRRLLGSAAGRSS